MARGLRLTAAAGSRGEGRLVQLVEVCTQRLASFGWLSFTTSTQPWRPSSNEVRSGFVSSGFHPFSLGTIEVAAIATGLAPAHNPSLGHTVQCQVHLHSSMLA